MAKRVVLEGRWRGCRRLLNVYVRSGFDLPGVNELVGLVYGFGIVKWTRVQSVDPDSRTYTIWVEI